VDSSDKLEAIEIPEDVSTTPTMRAVTDFDLGLRNLAPQDSPSTWAGSSARVEDNVSADELEELEGMQITQQTGAPPVVPPDGSLIPAEDLPPAREAPKYVTRPAIAMPTPQVASRRRFLRNALFAVGGTAVAWNLWGRRPVPVADIGFRPAALTATEFQTLTHAFEAILGDRQAALEAAATADINLQRLGKSSTTRLAADLKVLEFSPRGPVDGRRFSRLSAGAAAGVLRDWGQSRLANRRRIHADLQYLARYSWASRPASGLEFARANPSRTPKEG